MPFPKQGNSDFLHLQLNRLPNWEYNRRKPTFSGNPKHPPVPKDRAQHGAAISNSTATTLNQIEATREEQGIDSRNFLVVEFENINFGFKDLHKVFETRYQGNIVSESVEKGDEEDQYRVIVQFTNENGLNSFKSDADLYTTGKQDKGTIPPVERENFFNSLKTVKQFSREDRMGSRLKEAGYPAQPEFFLDVDLWHPGDNSTYDLIDKLRDICKKYAGEQTDKVQTSTLLLVKVRGNRELAEVLLNLDFVARVDLPPRVFEAYNNIFRADINFPNQTILPSEDDPLVCVVDSGVLSGHPLLANWVIEARDFDSGENTEVDLNGHGTAVAGIVAYGDIAICLEKNIWEPSVRICSAKVLCNNPNPWDPQQSEAVFPDKNRIERVINDAIRYFAKERNCRIFNLSVGTTEPYQSGRQFPWAELLDQLARELDIVIVVSAGNYSSPPIPKNAVDTVSMQKAIRKQLLDNHAFRIANPATAAIALTVGSIARTDALGPEISRTRVRNGVAAVPANTSSPFTRVGPGYGYGGKQTAVKPELVNYGGNYALATPASNNPIWVRNSPFLGEPTTHLGTNGRYVGAECGTSYACPHVAYAAAYAEKSLEKALGQAPSANLIRALVASSSHHPEYPNYWPKDEGEDLRLVGYGVSSVEELLWSNGNHVRLLASDEIEDDKLHLYKVSVPSDFFTTKGARGIKVALAYDPVVRASRRDYLAHILSFDLLIGLNEEEVKIYRTPFPDKGPPKLPQKNVIKLNPSKEKVEWSTLQVRQIEWKNNIKPDDLKIAKGETEPTIHLLIKSQPRFPTGLAPRQRYSVVLNIWHKNEQVELYQHIKSRIITQIPVRVRI